MQSFQDADHGSYTDAKGRLRWRQNDKLADQLKELHDVLVIGGYDPSHAARYPKLAYAISRLPEPVDELYTAGRITNLPGVGPTVATIIGQYLKTGDCDKRREWVRETPAAVLEMAHIPGLGAGMIRDLFHGHQIDSLQALGTALKEGRLAKVPGMGPKTLSSVHAYLSDANVGEHGRKPER